jgi:hypothetical protein
MNRFSISSYAVRASPLQLKLYALFILTLGMCEYEGL